MYAGVEVCCVGCVKFLNEHSDIVREDTPEQTDAETAWNKTEFNTSVTEGDDCDETMEESVGLEFCRRVKWERMSELVSAVTKVVKVLCPLTTQRERNRDACVEVMNDLMF